MSPAPTVNTDTCPSLSRENREMMSLFSSTPAVARPSVSNTATTGRPGVRSARYAGRDGDTPANNALLLKNLTGVADRRAHFACAIALIAPDGTVRHFEGRCDGRIAEAPSGEGGFGYDPLFIPDGHNRSFAELAPAEKNAISHRGRALAALRAALAFPTEQPTN